MSSLKPDGRSLAAPMRENRVKAPPVNASTTRARKHFQIQPSFQNGLQSQRHNNAESACVHNCPHYAVLALCAVAGMTLQDTD